MSNFDDPAWVQAAELFVEIVIPCEFFFADGLMVLGFDIIKEAEKCDCQVIYRTGSKSEVVDYTRTINSIKNWIVQNKELI
ncbi:MAG: hypothetical protein EAX91_14185 [Candidatus Lokiarchaeota archaeon]|nr:hypothetical protein [Candidatus Lokiarchaeota archaeon]